MVFLRGRDWALEKTSTMIGVARFAACAYEGRLSRASARHALSGIGVPEIT